MQTYDLRAVPYDCADAQMLTDQVKAVYVERYGGEGDTAPIDASEFADGHFVMAYVGDEPAAMGGWRRHRDYEAEIKRMYVRPEYQRQGLARAILTTLEYTASEAGITRLILETGLMQPEAAALYRSSGYDDVPAFGFYAADPLSVHLGKALT